VPMVAGMRCHHVAMKSTPELLFVEVSCISDRRGRYKERCGEISTATFVGNGRIVVCRFPCQRSIRPWVLSKPENRCVAVSSEKRCVAAVGTVVMA
jgi:hypothetical protein